MISVCPKLYLLFVALGGGRERLHQVVEGSEGLGRDRSCRSRTGKKLHPFIQSSVNELTWEKCLFIYFF